MRTRSPRRRAASAQADAQIALGGDDAIDALEADPEEHFIRLGEDALPYSGVIEFPGQSEDAEGWGGYGSRVARRG
ncbi:hypothetical protein [Sphingomonas sp. 22176]|uniref:hypothetical protein n=1 Tax=Sphingomonas sp. 22176 TaxID=3453884 RepID=UPI003F86BBD6